LSDSAPGARVGVSVWARARLMSVGLGVATSSLAPACSPPASITTATATATESTVAATAKVEHEHYVVVASRGPCDGPSCLMSATVTPKAPYHVNAEYPHRFVADGVAMSDASATVAPASLTVRATMPAPPSTTATISLRLFMSVCSDEKCLIEKVPLTL
jgi:hypothetical protein